MTSTTKKAQEIEQTIEVQEIQTREVSFNILGETPMIMHRFSQKAWQQLLLPSPQMNRAEREQTLKHDPVGEFRGSVYLNRDAKAPTRVHIPNGAFHGALASAALDIPGAKRTEIERLTRVTDVTINLFGLPKLFMAMVRNSGINRAPDVRTRAIFQEWACKITVRFVRPALTERTVANLLGAAGVIIGIGDWRGQKGGPYGAFRLVDENNKDFKRICATQGRVAQQKALDHPVAHDLDSEELLAWFEQEVRHREMEAKLSTGKGKKNGKAKLDAPLSKVIEETAMGDYLGIDGGSR